MTFRALAVLVFAAGAATLLAGLTVIGAAPGSPADARHLRRAKNRLAEPASYAPITLAEFPALPRHRPLAEVAALERRAVALEGFVQRTVLAGDGDLHLEVAPTPRPPGGPDTAYVTAEVTPGWRRGAPGWRPEVLRTVFRPDHGGPTPWERGTRRVRISGWLLYDAPYDRAPSPWSLAHAAPRVSGWEIHPVTRIEVWDDAAAAWREVPR